MNKNLLSERDICTKFITPALEEAGWDIDTQIREEFPLTKGRVIVRGKLHTRAKHKRADYVLFYKPNIPIAIIEAKDNSHSTGDGMQQGLGYADMLQVPFVFSSNGNGFLFHNKIATNILFFEKGGPTKDVWFFERPYPEDYKSYSRGKPLTIAEFDLEKNWWGGAQRKGRKTTGHAWKVSAKDIAARNYNLDYKNPHEVEVNHRDPAELMHEYQEIVRQLAKAQNAHSHRAATRRLSR